MSDGLSANEREEQRLAKALNRVKTPQRATSSPSLSRAVDLNKRAPEPRTATPPRAVAREVVRQPQPQPQPLVHVQVQVPTTASRESLRQAPAAREVVRPTPIVRQPQVLRTAPATMEELSDAELEAKCLKWLARMEPLLAVENSVLCGFEVGEEMHKSPRVAL